MPIFDYYCTKCGAEKNDELVQNSEVEVKCDVCENIMTKRPNTFAFTMTPHSISKFKKKVGNTIPSDYKTSGGANIYGVNRKN